LQTKIGCGPTTAPHFPCRSMLSLPALRPFVRWTAAKPIVVQQSAGPYRDRADPCQYAGTAQTYPLKPSLPRLSCSAPTKIGRLGLNLRLIQAFSTTRSIVFYSCNPDHIRSKQTLPQLHNYTSLAVARTIMEKVTPDLSSLQVQDDSTADRKLLIAVDFGTTFSGVAWAQTRRVCYLLQAFNVYVCCC
jgi:hypothetical protein